MSEIIKIKEVVKYGGHSLSANGSVNLTLKASYSELVNTILITQLLNNDVNIKAKQPGSKGMQLGSFRVKDLKIDHDGESILKFNGLKDFIEMDNLNELATGEEFVILMESEVEQEEDTDDE